MPETTAEPAGSVGFATTLRRPNSGWETLGGAAGRFFLMLAARLGRWSGPDDARAGNGGREPSAPMLSLFLGLPSGGLLDGDKDVRCGGFLATGGGDFPVFDSRTVSDAEASHRGGPVDAVCDSLNTGVGI
jgi:hypothetical protein